MSTEDIQKTRGTVSNFRDDRGGAAIIPSAVLGIVKDNIDHNRSGRIRVYLKRQESGNEDDPNFWTYVSYMSPFYGITPNTASSDAAGDFVGNPHSYGFWATPPDIGTEVICIFLNGIPDLGYYIGCVPKPGMTHMTPGLAASDNIIINNSGEAEGYGGATKLPVGEMNNANKKQDNSPLLSNQPRPVHSYQAAILNQQGLLRDSDRGAISSTSVRESPSRVFGISTPGRPIYEGGYDDKTIADAVQDDSIPDKNFRVVGRRGGHSIVLDDGDLTGKDQLVRLRTSTGHMIMMNDTIGSLFIIHANGQSYIEMGREGTIDMYSTNSVNIRTQGDLNLHADNDINLHAAKNFKLNAENISFESSKETTSFVGTKYSQFVKSDFTVKVNGAMSHESKGDASMKSSAISYVNGSKVNLNTGETSLVPKEVKQQPLVAHTDTLYDSKKGYAAAPAKLSSITSRAPAHSPWAGACQGVNVKTDMGADSNLPSAPSSNLNSVNQAAGEPTGETTKPNLAATVPNVNAASNMMSKGTTASLMSQMSVNAATGPLAGAIASGAGIASVAGNAVAAVGPLGLNPSQLVSGGILKPGADSVVNSLISQGKSLTQAMPTNLFTGQDGINNLNQLAQNIPAQASAATSLFSKAESALKSTNIISGSESPTQTAGLVLSAATAGLGKTADFVKSSVGGLSGAGLNLAGASGLGLKIPDSLSGGLGSVKNLVAGGNFAANMSDKVAGPLSGIPIGDQLKGAAAAAFSKVTGSFKTIGKIGSPVNLTVLKDQASDAAAAQAQEGASQTPEQKAGVEVLNQKLTSALGLGSGGSLKSALDSAESAIKGATAGITDPGQAMAAGMSALTKVSSSFGMDPSGLGNLPSGASLAGSVVNLNDTAKSIVSDATSGGVKLPGLPSVPGIPNIPGASGISSAISSITGSLTGGAAALTGAIGAFKGKLADGTKSLQSLASTGLGEADMTALNSSINAMGAGGPVEVKLPTVAKDSFDFGPILNQSKALLGNPKIPSLSFGSLSLSNIKIPTPAQAKEYDRLKAELDKEQDAYWDYQKAYLDLKAKKGPDDPETQTAYSTWQTSAKKIEQIRQDIGKSA